MRGRHIIWEEEEALSFQTLINNGAIYDSFCTVDLLANLTTASCCYVFLFPLASLAPKTTDKSTSRKLPSPDSRNEAPGLRISKRKKERSPCYVFGKIAASSSLIKTFFPFESKTALVFAFNFEVNGSGGPLAISANCFSHAEEKRGTIILLPLSLGSCHLCCVFLARGETAKQQIFSFCLFRRPRLFSSLRVTSCGSGCGFGHKI